MSTEVCLTHHGIEGQHWGIRRFQNPDGSLTPEGRQRYGVDGSPKIARPINTNYLTIRQDYRNELKDLRSDLKSAKESLKRDYNYSSAEKKQIKSDLNFKYAMDKKSLIEDRQRLTASAVKGYQLATLYLGSAALNGKSMRTLMKSKTHHGIRKQIEKAMGTLELVSSAAMLAEAVAVTIDKKKGDQLLNDEGRLKRG